MIKASQILFSLNERFITNPDKVGEVVDFLKRVTDNPRIQKWLSGVFRRYLINDCDRVMRILNYGDLPLNSPKWLTDAFKQGKKIYMVVLTRVARDEIEHDAVLVIQYFQSGDAPKRYDAMKFPVALARAKTWRKNVDRRVLDEKDPSVVEVVAKYGNNMTWVKLLEPDAYDREGEHMHNCLDRRYFLYGSLLYSLRDENNKPHASIEMDNKEFNQIKGYNNGPIEDRYTDICLDFINRHAKPGLVSKLGASDLEKNLGAIWSVTEKRVVRIPE